MMNGATLLGEQTEILFCKLCRSWASKTKESVDIRCLLSSRGGSGKETKVERKAAERPANGRDTANNLGFVDVAAIPSKCSCMGSLDKNRGSATIVGAIARQPC